MDRSALVAYLFAATAMLPLCASAQDMAVTAGKHVKVLLDNEKVRVMELSFAPGESTGMHSHGDNIVYYITGGKAKQTMGDGSTKERVTQPGEALWSGPVTHDTVNTGKSDVKVLIIELKAPAK
ncbi:cupin domain-containing protein [Lysobacter fragariae]